MEIFYNSVNYQSRKSIFNAVFETGLLSCVGSAEEIDEVGYLTF